MTRKSFIQSIFAIPAIISIFGFKKEPSPTFDNPGHKLLHKADHGFDGRIQFATSPNGRNPWTKVPHGSKEYDRIMKEISHN